MILVLAVALAALSVVAFGGKLSRLQAIRFRWPATIGAGLALQILIISILPPSVPSLLSRAIHLASYALAVVFLWVNRRIPWLWLIGLGGMSNLIAIGANGGVMPASRSALARAGRLTPIEAGTRSGFANSAYHAGEHLRLLGDIFDIPKGWPLANVFSVGDVLIVVGCTLLLHAVCRSRPATALSDRFQRGRARILVRAGRLTLATAERMVAAAVGRSQSAPAILSARFILFVTERLMAVLVPDGVDNRSARRSEGGWTREEPAVAVQRGQETPKAPDPGSSLPGAPSASEAAPASSQRPATVSDPEDQIAQLSRIFFGRGPLDRSGPPRHQAEYPRRVGPDPRPSPLPLGDRHPVCR